MGEKEDTNLDVLEEGGLEGGDLGGVHLVQEAAHAAVDDGNLGGGEDGGGRGCERGRNDGR